MIIIYTIWRFPQMIFMHKNSSFMGIHIFQKKEKTFMNLTKDFLISKLTMNIDKLKKFCLTFIMNSQGMLKSGIKELNLKLLRKK
jgi:hypothetical protein